MPREASDLLFHKTTLTTLANVIRSKRRKVRLRRSQLQRIQNVDLERLSWMKGIDGHDRVRLRRRRFAANASKLCRIRSASDRIRRAASGLIFIGTGVIRSAELISAAGFDLIGSISGLLVGAMTKHAVGAHLNFKTRPQING